MEAGAEEDIYTIWSRVFDDASEDVSGYLTFYGSLLSADLRSLLELGCGTGRVLSWIERELAAKGAAPSLVGVDLSPSMLDIARARPTGVRWILGDLREPPLDETFDLVVCCYNTLQLLIDDGDLARTFRNVRRALAPGGRFAFDVYRPNEAFLLQPKSIVHPYRGSPDIEQIETFTFDPKTRLLHCDVRLVDPKSPDEPRAEINAPMRQYTTGEVEESLRRGGLKIVERYGDLDRSAFTPESRKQVIVAEAAS